MEKVKVYGTYPDLAETARRLGLTQDEVESVRSITRKVRQDIRSGETAGKAKLASTDFGRARQAS